MREVYTVDMKSRKKSRIIDSYIKPKTVKKFVKFPYKRVRIDWIDIITEGGAPVYITNKANLYLGKIPYMKGDFEAAEDFLISAANSAKDSSGAEAQYLLASISYKQQKYKQSLETLFELTDKFKMFDRWVLRSLLLVADNYLALEEVFQAKTTLNSIVSKSKDEEMVRLASAKLDEIIAKESQGVNPESK